MTKNLFRSTTLVASMTTISRVLGFLRDMLIAQLFGAGPAMDAFYVAFRIPNFMRALFAEGAFAQAFVPVLAEYKQLHPAQETIQFIRHIQTSLAVILLLVTGVAMCSMPMLTAVFAPGFKHDPYRFVLATNLLRITFPYLFLISMTAFYAAVLNVYGNFGVSSFTPVFLNLAMIISAVWLRPYFAQSATALAWGVLIAGILQLSFLLFFLKIRGLLYWPKLKWQDKGVVKVLHLLIPALFGVSVAQISLVLDTLFASFLPQGSIVWLYYSDRLIYFPLGIFGVALATVILPHLSCKHATRSLAEFSSTLDWALRCVLVIAIPAALGLYLLAEPLFIALFQYGKFSVHDAHMASLSLKAYAFGLPAFMLVKVLASGFYARQAIKTPVRIAIVALIFNMLLNIVLIGQWHHVGLALATAISSSVNAALLWWCLIKQAGYQVSARWHIYLLKLGLAGIAMIIMLYYCTMPDPVWIAWSRSERMLHLLALIVGGVGIYLVCIRLMGLKLKDFYCKQSVS